jgi:hypothetical protein
MDEACTKAADRGAPVAQAAKARMLAHAMRLSRDELRRVAKAISAGLGFKADLDVDRVLADPANEATLRLGIANEAEARTFAKAKPHLLQTVTEHHTQENVQHVRKTAGLMALSHAIGAVPTSACPPPRRPNERGAGNKRQYDRDLLHWLLDMGLKWTDGHLADAMRDYAAVVDGLVNAPRPSVAWVQQQRIAYRPSTRRLYSTKQKR